MTQESFTVDILPDGIRIRAKAGVLLADALLGAGVPLSLYCHKKSVCGKCAVRIISGPLPILEAREKELLDRRSLGLDHRLACRYEIRGNATIEIVPGSRLEKVAVLETGISTPVAFDPLVTMLTATLEKASLEVPDSLVERLGAALDTPDLTLSHPALRRLGTLEGSAGAPVTAVLYGDREVLGLEPGEASRPAFGLAIDIGTSTVVVELVDLGSGKSVDRISAMNCQVSYGADVVSRITSAFENPAGLLRLQNAIIGQLNDLVGDLAARHAVAVDRIFEAVIAGNTAMNHFLSGVTVDPLALAPFSAVFSGIPAFPASEIGLKLNPSAKVYLVPNIKSFVGGDVAAGITAAALAQGSGPQLFIDLGTNGEIVLKKGRQLAATSTAAGPAFEGMSISCGMLAVPGAVCRAEWADGFRLHTIGGLPPHGVCGTGLIDIVALGVGHGLIEPNGRITTPDKTLHLAEGLALKQQDIREIQLAAAAIKTGVHFMLKEFHVAVADLDKVYLAGAFGNSLDIRNSKALGLLPDIPEAQIAFIGNSSLAGARKLLLSGPERAVLEALVKDIAHVPLASRLDFQDEFVRALEIGSYPWR